MRTVKIGELKARLSAHLHKVQSGEEVLVCDRNRPVARIVPYQSTDHADHERRLVSRGVLVPPRKPRSNSSLPKPVGKVSKKVMERVWRDERGR